MSYAMYARSARWALPSILVLLAALLALRVAGLAYNATDLFFDEAQYWFWGEQPALGYYSKPPLLAWLIRAVTDVCGEDTFCIRLASPILHTGTALFVFLTARHLYDGVVGFWAGLFYATLPGVSVSAGIISTDVPLLFCYAAALYAFVRFFDEPTWGGALLLGLAIGAGLMAKYAMLFFVAGVIFFLVFTPTYRRLLIDRRFIFSLFVAFLVVSPNLYWNLQNSGVTFSHTADNANWSGAMVNPIKALEFFGAQFGVFGPILFSALLIIVWRAFTRGIPEPDRLMLFFAIPVLVVITVQALLSRAHANWAATAYISASIVVAATMLRDGSILARYASMALHVAILFAVVSANALAGTFQLPNGADPYARVLGWRSAIDGVRSELKRAGDSGEPYRLVLADDRAVAAELTYYLRNDGVAVRAWVNGPGLRDHYEQVVPYEGQRGPILFVHHRPNSTSVTENFRQVEALPTVEGKRGFGPPRLLYLYRLNDYKLQLQP